MKWELFESIVEIMNKSILIIFLSFFACPKKDQKKAPEIDYIPISGRFPDLALVLLWLVHLEPACRQAGSTLRVNRFKWKLTAIDFMHTQAYFSLC